MASCVRRDNTRTIWRTAEFESLGVFHFRDRSLALHLVNSIPSCFCCVLDSSFFRLLSRARVDLRFPAAQILSHSIMATLIPDILQLLLHLPFASYSAEVESTTYDQEGHSRNHDADGNFPAIRETLVSIGFLESIICYFVGVATS